METGKNMIERRPLDRGKNDLLMKMAAKYLWWKQNPDGVAQPERIVAQVMNIGDYQDVQTLVKVIGDAYLKQVLANAEAGQFNERSWAYWHYRLGLAAPGEVPPMPQRDLN
jgi:hypothetical protein